MKRLSRERRVQILAALVEGNSIRSIVRMTGTSKGAILRLLEDVGHACHAFHDAKVKDVAAKRLQCDEIWGFCYCKEKTKPYAKAAHGKGAGSVFTFTALDPDSKLLVDWHLGPRDGENALYFMRRVALRLSHRVQLTTDAFAGYLRAVVDAFGEDVDYAQLHKLYGPAIRDESRYSPPACIGAIPTPLIGEPVIEDVSTSHVERNNLTMRMGMRRLTRLTNGFSKKLTNMRYAVALHFVYYNFVRVHQTLGTTPAIEAGITERRWTMEDLADLPARMVAFRDSSLNKGQQGSWA